jgi:SNF2 family DNA or RNA helicase
MFLDFDFVPAIMDQAIDRVHRPGQVAEKVMIYQLIAKNTIDDKMMYILEEKRKIFDQLINNKTIVSGEQGSLVNDLIKVYEKY